LISAISPTTTLKRALPTTPEQHIALHLKTRFTYGELGKQETIEQLFQFASNGIAPSTSVNPQTKQDALSLHVHVGDELLKARSGDARLELFMSVFLAQFGQYDEAIQHLTKASALSPQKQQILFQLGGTYIQKGDFTSAVPILKKAFDLDTSYKLRAFSMLGHSMYANQKAQADALLKEGFGTVTPDDDQLLQIYGNTKQYDRVVAIWKMRVDKNPKTQTLTLVLLRPTLP
jgi:tetratricopeptide (TPR) repeat protein